MKITRLLKLLTWLNLLLGLSFGVAAETVYVSDTLRVGVRTEPNNQSSPTGVVKSGMKLEVLGSQQEYLEVKTEDGLTGWIKKIYTIKQPPASIRLKQEQDKYEQQNNHLKELQATLSALQSTNSSLTKQVEELKEDRSRLQLLQARSVSNQQDVKSTWYWWLIALLVLSVGGFFGGVQWSQHQTMKRLGGLRL